MEYGSGFIFSVGLVLVLIWALSMWQVFYKAGYAGWKCLIPIYNMYILTKIGSQPIWVFIMLYIPFVNFIAMLLIALSIAKAFGKGPAFAIIGLFLFSFFGYMVIGWGDSEYEKIEVEA